MLPDGGAGYPSGPATSPSSLDAPFSSLRLLWRRCGEFLLFRSVSLLEINLCPGCSYMSILPCGCTVFSFPFSLVVETRKVTLPPFLSNLFFL